MTTRGALKEAATSLETISQAGFKDKALGCHIDEIRGYAGSRARAAREALSHADEEPGLRDVLAEIGTQLQKAQAKHAPMHGPHEGYAVILEELDELWEEVRAQKQYKEKMRHEALHVAAMAARFVIDVCATPPAQSSGAEVCTWTGEGSSWFTSCGDGWVLEDGEPEDNGIKFCHHCGKPVKFVREDDPTPPAAEKRTGETLITHMGNVKGWEECKECGASWRTGEPERHWHDCSHAIPAPPVDIEAKP